MSSADGSSSLSSPALLSSTPTFNPTNTCSPTLVSLTPTFDPASKAGRSVSGADSDLGAPALAPTATGATADGGAAADTRSPDSRKSRKSRRATFAEVFTLQPDNFSELHKAVEENDVDAVRRLVSARANLDCEGNKYKLSAMSMAEANSEVFHILNEAAPAKPVAVSRRSAMVSTLGLAGLPDSDEEAAAEGEMWYGNSDTEEDDGRDEERPPSPKYDMFA